MALHTLAMSLFPYAFPILFVLPISIFLVLRKSKNGSSNIKVPPGSCGWPVVGESFKYVSLGTQQFMGERRSKYSTDVFRTSIFGQKMAVFCGAQGNKFVFTKLLTSWWPVTVKKILFSPEFSHIPVDEASAAMHRFVHEILKPEALKNYIPVMDAMAREHVESKWDGNDVVMVHPLSKEYTFNLAYRLFVNVIDDIDHVRRIYKHFAFVTSGMFSVPINLPGTAYSRGIKGGELIREEIVKIITRRREEMEKKETTLSYTDCLSRILLVTDGNGKFMSEEEMSNYIIALLIGSYESTSTAVSFVLKYLAELPHIYDEIYKELMEIAESKGEGEMLKWEDIQKMRCSWNVVCETLRLTPPVQGGFREASWTAYTTHKDPECFPDPEKFDPSRFEGNGPAPYTFVPFGGGPRMCCGKEYARLEVLVFIYNIVTRFKLQIINPQEKIAFHSFPIPMEGLPLRIIRHNM
ncbi:beta-amyrin 6-beta-monooxygenase-like isoform X2 [Apium graveolens]|uniref:beta-amyrin 6-beta-monooxygenase-like isoform X2 n=1 Tax=Apium graveolens TaxID=4045 RepID=UPI003D7B0CA6